ncbi:MAG: hypothetical protein AAF449_19830, partial [Myxococcota bacterium]
NHWTLGLDPNFTHEVDPKLYHTSVAIGSGQVSEPGRLIEQYFGAKYVIATNKSPAAGRTKSASGGLKKVYGDEHASVFQVVPVPHMRTVEAELEPYETDLAEDLCRHRHEQSSDLRATFLQCRQKEPRPFVLRYTVDLPADAEYKVQGRIMTGATNGTLDVLVDGQTVTQNHELSGQRRTFKKWDGFGKFRFGAGKKTVEIRVRPEMPHKWPVLKSGRRAKWPIEVGIDAIRFTRVR